MRMRVWSKTATRAHPRVSHRAAQLATVVGFRSRQGTVVSWAQ